MRYLLILLLLVFISSDSIHSKQVYGYNIDEQVIKKQLREEFLNHPLLINRGNQINSIEKTRNFHPKNTEFLIGISCLLFIGLFRVKNHLYFRNIFKAFRNPTLTARQLKDQLQQDTVSNVILNFFFCISLSLYTFQVLNYFQSNWIQKFGSGAVLLGILLSFISIYSFRFLFLKLTGRLFEIPEASDDYSFQILLINKILGILLIPFTIVISFAEGEWVQVALFLSFIIITLLLIYRYLRSGFLFLHFLRFSKFHFILYLCASEILPIAILIKLFSKI